ncbi:MAG: NAD(P)H-hydrate dehydratase [Chitinophagales bacterium]|nr:NAD(P)H-hydrate dehydratase [Sphingobacteriales bacterium]MBP9140666.1 NAD(P)H-hydrate dehydratase [Chitinophagales bacterium]MDA0198912.1 NAD(P)H-hydrate dehydratase [Bacteroidota bacterium]MBK6889098.1 NAD(P)H-hydrate dehydratase [Sphingobacteriales bacterium]MBK8680138.1 NAD(P)H-hydrate dehydratase [Sphingobacteriales bacterium]
MQKILTTTQLQQADAYTIANEPIASYLLMERAATAFFNLFLQLPCVNNTNDKPVHILATTGNNGGDGLCVAYLLKLTGFKVRVSIFFGKQPPSNDFSFYYDKITSQNTDNHNPIFFEKFNSDANDATASFPEFNPDEIIIDALFGTGLNRPILSGFYANLITHINNSNAITVAIDLPSGLFANQHTPDNAFIVKATYTISFQTVKLAFLLPQNHRFVGQWQVVDIGLHPLFLQNVTANYFYLTQNYIAKTLQPRNKFAHKGNNGRVLIIAGSNGLMGAAILASKACLKTGAGLVTAYIPAIGYTALQTAIPECMVKTDDCHTHLANLPNAEFLQNFNVIAIGPGLGQNPQTANLLQQLLQWATENNKPLLIDADAINLIAKHNLINLVPPNSLLTPHWGEFHRLLPHTPDNDFDRLAELQKIASKHKIYIALKGAHTCIAFPDEKLVFNSTGNPYMATAGSGDVLTGMIASFLAQGYLPNEAICLGVFFHGKAGDAAHLKLHNIIARELIDHICIK